MPTFNPFKKKDWRKAGRDIERGLDKAAEKAKREAERAARETQKAAERAAKEAEKAAVAAAKEAERVAHYFEKEAERVVQQIFERAKREIEEVAERAVREAKEAITEDLPGLAQTAIEEAQRAMLREAVRKTLNVAVDLVDTVAPDSLSLTLGPVHLDVGDIVDKVQTIKHLADHPPDDADSITEAVLALAPDQISIELSVGVGFIVQSDSAQVGISLGWSKESVLEHLPALLRKCGVPG